MVSGSIVANNMDNQVVQGKAVQEMSGTERFMGQVTYGCELEWSDIDRTIDIPKELGSWEGPKMAGRYMGSEIDIVNTQGKYAGVAVDPLCISCPVGGEIHTVPSWSIESQLCRIMRIMELFPKLGVACPNHGHIHVGIPDLKTDLGLLKNFFKYLECNEDDLIRFCCGFDADEHDRVVQSELPEWAKKYFIIGDGKHIAPELYKAIAAAESMEEAMNALRTIPCLDWDCCTGEYYETDGSHRTAVNMFNLTKGNTIEFRIFRASLNPLEIWSTLDFVRNFVQQASLGEKGASVTAIIKDHRYQFPKLNFDMELAAGWVFSRQTKGRCGPFKKSFSSADYIGEDPAIAKAEVDPFEQGLLNILGICAGYCNGYENVFEELRHTEMKPLSDPEILPRDEKSLIMSIDPRPADVKVGGSKTYSK